MCLIKSIPEVLIVSVQATGIYIFLFYLPTLVHYSTLRQLMCRANFFCIKIDKVLAQLL